MLVVFKTMKYVILKRFFYDVCSTLSQSDMKVIVNDIVQKADKSSKGMCSVFRRVCAFILCSALLFIMGCEETVENPELPYEEKIVIKSYVVAGEKEVFVSISKTLPLIEKYTFDAALIKDAEVTIICPEGSFNALYDSEIKVYKAIIPAIKVGARYELDVKWKGKKAKASTSIPALPSIIKLSTIVDYDSKYRYTRDYTLTCDFSYDPNICVGLLGDVLSSEKRSDSVTMEYSYDILNSFYNAKTAIGNGEYIRFKKTSSLYIYNNNNNSYKYNSVFFAAFDAPYHAMNLSGSRYGNNDDIFGSSGSNPKFNISGDGIGYFIGVHVFPRIYWIPIEY